MLIAILSNAAFAFGPSGVQLTPEKIRDSDLDHVLSLRADQANGTALTHLTNLAGEARAIGRKGCGAWIDER